MACSKCSYTGAACNYSDLFDDLLIEIMIRLPPKSLFRSKCVSRTWRCLISSDHVQKRLPFVISGIYGHHNAKNFKHQYVCMSNGKFIDCNLSFFPFHSNSRIISCCNGLLLFSSHSSQLLHVCNPVTKEWLTLPRTNKSSLLPVLAFDPSLSPHYKVICFTSWQEQGVELEVFSSETGNWAEFNVHLGVESHTLSSIISYFDDVLCILSNPHRIVCIHLKTMALQQIELPEPARPDAQLGKNGGHICYYPGNDDGKQSVWMLENHSDTCKWALKHNISLKAITEKELSRLGSTRFLAFHPELEVVYLSVERKLVSYDMIKKRIEVVGDFGMERERGCLVGIWLFQFSNYLSDCLLNEKQWHRLWFLPAQRLFVAYWNVWSQYGTI